MRPILEFWLSLSRLNRIAFDLLLFWLAAGTVLGLGAMSGGAVRELVPPFLAVTVVAGVAGTLVAAVESIRRLHGSAHPAANRVFIRQRNLRVAILLAFANAFPAFVLALAWMRGIPLFR